MQADLIGSKICLAIITYIAFVALSYSYVIYPLSTEVKRQDGQSYDSWLTLVVNEIILKSGIGGIKLNSRLLAIFRKKISSLQSACKRTNKVGGWILPACQENSSVSIR